MRTIARIAFVLASITVVCTTEVTSGSNAEEYAVYSAFINQTYLQPDRRAGFSLNGTIIEGFGPTRIEEVVILPQTLPSLDYYISQTTLRSMLPAVAHPAFGDYLKNNDRPYPLARNFKLKVAYSFFSEHDGNAASSFVNDPRSPAGRFAARHPNALGYLSLSRVGFTNDYNVAVVGFAQTDFNARPELTRMWGGLALLRKEGGRWTVQNVYSNSTAPKPLTIQLGRCAPDSRHLAWGLGSAYVLVKGRQSSACVIQHTSELEGGFTRSECRVPVSIRTLTIYTGNTDFYYSDNISRRCKLIESGNLIHRRLHVPPPKKRP